MGLPKLTPEDRARRLSAWFRSLGRDRDLNIAAISRRSGLSRETIEHIRDGVHRRNKPGHRRRGGTDEQKPYVPLTETLWYLAVGLATHGEEDVLDEAEADRYYREAMRAAGWLPESEPSVELPPEALAELRRLPSDVTISLTELLNRPWTEADTEAVRLAVDLFLAQRRQADTEAERQRQTRAEREPA